MFAFALNFESSSRWEVPQLPLILYGGTLKGSFKSFYCRLLESEEIEGK